MEQKKEIKPEALSNTKFEEVFKEREKLLKQGITDKETHTAPQDSKPEDADPYRSREVAKEKPATKTYEPVTPSRTPNVKDKSKGRSL